MEESRRAGLNLWKKLWNRLRRHNGSWKPSSFVYQFDMPFEEARRFMADKNLPFEWAIRK